MDRLLGSKTMEVLLVLEHVLDVMPIKKSSLFRLLFFCIVKQITSVHDWDGLEDKIQPRFRVVESLDQTIGKNPCFLEPSAANSLTVQVVLGDGGKYDAVVVRGVFLVEEFSLHGILKNLSILHVLEHHEEGNEELCANHQRKDLFLDNNQILGVFVGNGCLLWSDGHVLGRCPRILQAVGDLHGYDPTDGECRDAYALEEETFQLETILIEILVLDHRHNRFADLAEQANEHKREVALVEDRWLVLPVLFLDVGIIDEAIIL